ncbi:hypothetical protein GGI25_003823 [Coemansia spiralis]|uniref:Calcineurin-like phosphoesterase domain-containing protein n=2 Tax=Coemansia TaxID=4863 RepID=A0A9W8G7A3_9FUNG|nr:hypothetical protein EDC05_003690 [Coemansia umbellata]KAJ2620980.1 hypothetical protein GGI26_004480 [Coemansia sp. RSA 1358]KAJ2675729.1 hypothetical protein GGI25_003823 [Coemansia spiralis]
MDILQCTLRFFKLVAIFIAIFVAVYALMSTRSLSSINALTSNAKKPSTEAGDNSAIEAVLGKLSALGLSSPPLSPQHNLAEQPGPNSVVPNPATTVPAPASSINLYLHKKYEGNNNEAENTKTPAPSEIVVYKRPKASANEIKQFRATRPILFIKRKFEVGSEPKRLIFIGDIHGCLNQFNNLLEKLDYQQGSDQVVLVGDLVAKGPDSIGVLRKARNINAWCTRGNHDDKVIRWREFLEGPGNGLTKTEVADLENSSGLPYSDFRLSDPHYDIARSMSPNDFAFIKSFPVIMAFPPPYAEWVVVHGGLDPSKSILKQNSHDCMNMRNIGSSGPSSSHNEGLAWFEVYAAKMKILTHSSSLSSIDSEDFSQITFNKVVYGHDAGRALQMHEYTKGLDSGCVYGGSLTAFILPGEQLVSFGCPNNDGSAGDDKDEKENKRRRRKRHGIKSIGIRKSGIRIRRHNKYVGKHLDSKVSDLHNVQQTRQKPKQVRQQLQNIYGSSSTMHPHDLKSASNEHSRQPQDHIPAKQQRKKKQQNEFPQ